MLLFLSIYIIVLQKQSIVLHPIVNNYLNDFISIILVLKICEIVLKKIKTSNLKLKKRHVFFATAYFSLLFEVVFPVFLSRYTADFYDVIAYFLGAFVFILLENHDS